MSGYLDEFSSKDYGKGEPVESFSFSVGSFYADEGGKVIYVTPDNEEYFPGVMTLNSIDFDIGLFEIGVKITVYEGGGVSVG